MPVEMEILRAVYGMKDVTESVKKRLTPGPQGEVWSGEALIVDNSWLSDGWLGVLKTMTVFYRYGGRICTACFREHENMKQATAGLIGLDSPVQTPFGVNIYGASYGAADVTAQFIEAAMAMGASPGAPVLVPTQLFGPLNGERKSFVVLYSLGDDPAAAPLSLWISEVRDGEPVDFSALFPDAGT